MGRTQAAGGDCIAVQAREVPKGPVNEGSSGGILQEENGCLAPARPLAVHLPLVVVAQGLGDDLAAFSHLLVVAPSRRRRARVTAGEILPPPRSRLNRRI